MSEHENPDIELLKSCLDKKIEEIFVTGYSEITEDYNYFSPMLWWYYIKLEDFFLCVASDSNIGVLKFHLQKEIQCNFEIEENVFTISTVNKEDYSGQRVVGYDVFFGNDDSHIYGIGVQFEDNKYVHKSHKYIFFSCLSFDGIIFGDKREMEEFLKDSRFRLMKIKPKIN